MVNLLQLNAGYQFIIIVNSLPILLEPEKISWLIFTCWK